MLKNDSLLLVICQSYKIVCFLYTTILTGKGIFPVTVMDEIGLPLHTVPAKAWRRYSC
jgi:hypothetical protein